MSEEETVSETQQVPDQVDLSTVDPQETARMIATDGLVWLAIGTK